MPAGALLASFDGPLKFFGGLLVTVEEPCDASELPGGLADLARHMGTTATGSTLPKNGTISAVAEAGKPAGAVGPRSVVPMLGRRGAPQFVPPKPHNAQEGSRGMEAPAQRATRTESEEGPPQARHCKAVPTQPPAQLQAALTAYPGCHVGEPQLDEPQAPDPLRDNQPRWGLLGLRSGPEASSRAGLAAIALAASNGPAGTHDRENVSQIRTGAS